MSIKSYDTFIKLANKTRVKDPEKFLKYKKEICKKIKLPLPTNADLRETYEKMFAQGKIKRNLNLESALFSKKIRTESGVAVVAVLTKNFPCPGKCIYCPTEKEMPKSYLSNEPAVMRAISAKFDPYIQVQKRIRALELNGHKTDKIELIVMGGTFSYLPKSYQLKFILRCFQACNDYGNKIKNKKNEIMHKQLILEQKKNEKAKHRIISLTLETRPDYINKKELLNFRNLGCTRVELGVQSIFDDILKINNRGHSIEETIKATQLLKNFGFKISYHIMPGLLGSTLKRDYLMFQELFKNPSFQPDMLKIYPTVVIRQSPLYRLWKSGEYKPLNDEDFKNFILRVKNKIIPPYVRISRLVRDVPEISILAGPKISNLRQMIQRDSVCRCIRCREVRSHYDLKEKIFLHRIDYKASDGKEIFLEYTNFDKKKLFALLRLRINEETTFCPDVLKNSAIIREVHTYGKMTPINKKERQSPQHIGLGKKLIKEAEKIARTEFDLKKISVISGIGVRNYYRKLGYRLQDSYMVKKLTD